MEFELLVSADAVVPDHDAAVAQCQDEWGLPYVDPKWTVAPEGTGGKWTFIRLRKDRRLAPTAFEILGIPYHPPDPDHRPTDYAYLPEIAASQGSRPARNHSTVLSTLDFPAVLDTLTATGADFRLDQPHPRLPAPRLWIGFSDEHPDVYDPRTDGGLRLEILPHEAFRLPPASAELSSDSVEEGEQLRVVSRTIVVDDLDAVRRTLDEHLHWGPASDRTGPDGVRRATFHFAYSNSATLEVIEPSLPAVEADVLQRWGPGPFSIRIEVDDLDALRDRLLRKKVPHTELPPVADDSPPRVYRPATFELGTAFEFVPADR